ncbi:MAG: ATP-binding protein [Xenococcaceae cyanobacterium]
MSYSYIATGSEFAALCQSQMEILCKGLGAVWSAVYLTEELVESQPKQLIPFAIYPHNQSIQKHQLPPIGIPESWHRLKSSPRLISDPVLQSTNSAKMQITQEVGAINSARKQTIVPLAYQDMVLGLLVIGQKNLDWTEQELRQIEEIAQTLAIARFLDCSDRWHKQQLAKQEKLNRLERDRLDNLLHQLRNPLTALRTFSKLLIKRLLPEDRNQSVAKNILREGDRLQELLKQFEVESERQAQSKESFTLDNTPILLTGEHNTSSNFLLTGNTAKLEPIEINQIIEPLIVSARAIAREKNIEVSYSIPARLPLMTVNSQALREALNNIIDNAIKYTPLTGKVEISLDIKKEINCLEIAIKDTGYGIRDRDREHIFERHYRGVQAEGNIEGTGLGLAIAQDLVREINGKIKVISPNYFSENSKFPGTTFLVLLPLTVNSEQKPEKDSY